jgi:hypothetical protein
MIWSAIAIRSDAECTSGSGTQAIPALIVTLMDLPR